MSGRNASLDAVRDAFRAWLDEAWDPELTLLEWRNRLADAGWACPTWPHQWCGRGLSAPAADVVAEELFRIGAPGVATGVGMLLAAPTILEHGSEDLKHRLIRPTVTGEITWCQLFSEPGAGSDLAGLTTRVERDGDEWVVNGQKVWNTSAHHADYGLLLGRTDWDVPKHHGITYLALPMRQPGVEVRPLRQMNGHASFNEVFLDDARVPSANVIGELGGGWSVALHDPRPRAPPRGHPHRPADVVEPEPGAARRRGRAGRRRRALPVVPAARRAIRPRRRPRRRHRRRLRSHRAPGDREADLPRVASPSGPRSGPRRPAPSGVHRGPKARWASWPPAASLARQRARTPSSPAPPGCSTGADSPLGGTIAEVFVSVPAVSIAGGTDEIQHNILAERILGLPKEPAVDRDLPFREVRTSSSRH